MCQKSPDIKDALDLLAKCKNEWEMIGTMLGISYSTLNGFHGSDGDKLARVIAKWEEVERVPFTWQALVEVLESDILELNRIARKIKDELSKPKLYSKYIELPDFE